MTRHVALVGFMAAGKTTVGRELARELGVAFCDTDDAIEARHGSIAELFARAGETGFRAAELEAVREALAAAPGVIALGGGALTQAETRELVRAGALSVYLEVPAETLTARLQRARVRRPMLGATPTEEDVRALLTGREPAYREADIIVPAPDGSKRGLAQTIARRLREYGAVFSEAPAPA